MDEVPFQIDIETSIEQAGEDKLLKEACNSANLTNARRSLYDLSIGNLNDAKHESVEFKDYESRLQQEMKDWKSVLFNAYKSLKQSKEKHPIVDKTILPPEKREYLEKAECLQKFIRESIEFRQEAVLFLEYDFAAIREMVESVETMFEHKLNLIKSNKIAENLANVSKKTN